MAIALFIVLLVWLLYRLLRKKRNDSVSSESVRSPTPSSRNCPISADEKPYRITEKHVRLLQRKTYIKGILTAKFHGELDLVKEIQHYVRERYFDISLYDAHIIDSEFLKNNEGPFMETSDEGVFPGRLEPNPLPCSISYHGIAGRYAILLQEVKLFNIDFDKYRLLHMEEDDLVFGTIEAIITGHILENFREECEVRVPVPKPAIENSVTPIRESGLALTTIAVSTGKTKIANGYRWKESWNPRDGSSSWGKPIYTGGEGSGCLGHAGLLFLALFVLGFLFAIGPHGVLALLFVVAVALATGFLSVLVRPMLWLLAALVFFTGLFFLLRIFTNGPVVIKVPFSQNQANDYTIVVPVATVNKGAGDSSPADSIIVHHRVWTDYADSIYEGNIVVRASDLARSSEFKNRLILPRDPIVAYNQMLGAVESRDSTLLPAVYTFFDSLRVSHHLDFIRFAKVLVSFVQDIPYALILDGGCDPNLYSDAFIRSYLQSPDAVCSGFQRFGIHTPVEFMGTFLGDCDTRTLFLYTLLDHYGYDVAILSSEVYSHSLLGIVLPVEGTAYLFHDRRYVLWETTMPQMPPGIIAARINNLFNWRISIYSKN